MSKSEACLFHVTYNSLQSDRIPPLFGLKLLHNESLNERMRDETSSDENMMRFCQLHIHKSSLSKMLAHSVQKCPRHVLSFKIRCKIVMSFLLIPSKYSLLLFEIFANIFPIWKSQSSQLSYQVFFLQLCPRETLVEPGNLPSCEKAYSLRLFYPHSIHPRPWYPSLLHPISDCLLFLPKPSILHMSVTKELKRM